PTPAFSPPLFELVDLAGHTDEDLPPRLPVRVETRSLPALPQGPHLRRVDLPVRARSPRDLAQVRVQLSDRRAAPVPVPVVDLVDLQPGLQHEGVRDHGLVVRIRVLLDAEVPCNDPIPVVEERPIRADPEPEVVERDEVAIRGNGYEPREAYGALLREGDELVELLPVLGAVDAPVEGEHHRVVALEERELPRRVRVVGEFEVRECRAGDDVFSHGVVLVDGGWFVGVEHVSGPPSTPASGGPLVPSLVARPGRPGPGGVGARPRPVYADALFTRPWRAPPSSLRERMSSFANTLCRWYSTVLGLMKSWLPISGFVCPSAARRATCASCAVRTS